MKPKKDKKPQLHKAHVMRARSAEPLPPPAHGATWAEIGLWAWKSGLCPNKPERR
jgi:hypothetical protein